MLLLPTCHVAKVVASASTLLQAWLTPKATYPMEVTVLLIACSKHAAAGLHAAARAVSGACVYVSDKPGQHDFAILKQLVLSDGSVLRGLLPGRPTLDCLFLDPLRDNQSLLKVLMAADSLTSIPLDASGPQVELW